MTTEPTPFQRLIRLENLVSGLEEKLHHPTPSVDESALPQRHVWPADELLLTRLIRRNPEALKAYEAPAELIQAEGKGVLLKDVPGNSPFRLCELTNGDAVVWLAREHEAWLYNAEIFRLVFEVTDGSGGNEPLVLQLLPRFTRKVQGKEWTLDRPGQMIPTSRPFVEQADQAELERRIQKLEQTFARMQGRFDSDIGALRSHVQVLQDQLNRLLMLNCESDMD
jgi:hypothetical protein